MYMSRRGNVWPRFYSTYKELKRHFVYKYIYALIRFYSTYKELKHGNITYIVMLRI